MDLPAILKSVFCCSRGGKIVHGSQFAGSNLFADAKMTAACPFKKILFELQHCEVKHTPRGKKLSSPSDTSKSTSLFHWKRPRIQSRLKD